MRTNGGDAMRLAAALAVMLAAPTPAAAPDGSVSEWCRPGYVCVWRATWKRWAYQRLDCLERLEEYENGIWCGSDVPAGPTTCRLCGESCGECSLSHGWAPHVMACHGSPLRAPALKECTATKPGDGVPH